jgi:hypothetical protein
MTSNIFGYKIINHPTFFHKESGQRKLLGLLLCRADRVIFRQSAKAELQAHSSVRILKLLEQAARAARPHAAVPIAFKISLSALLY